MLYQLVLLFILWATVNSQQLHRFDHLDDARIVAMGQNKGFEMKSAVVNMWNMENELPKFHEEAQAGHQISHTNMDLKHYVVEAKDNLFVFFRKYAQEVLEATAPVHFFHIHDNNVPMHLYTTPTDLIPRQMKHNVLSFIDIMHNSVGVVEFYAYMDNDEATKSLLHSIQSTWINPFISNFTFLKSVQLVVYDKRQVDGKAVYVDIVYEEKKNANRSVVEESGKQQREVMSDPSKGAHEAMSAANQISSLAQRLLKDHSMEPAHVSQHQLFNAAQKLRSTRSIMKNVSLELGLEASKPESAVLEEISEDAHVLQQRSMESLVTHVQHGQGWVIWYVEKVPHPVSKAIDPHAAVGPPEDIKIKPAQGDAHHSLGSVPTPSIVAPTRNTI